MKKVFVWLLLALIPTAGYLMFSNGEEEVDVEKILLENLELKKAIKNLSTKNPIALVKVLERKEGPEGIEMTIKFAEVDQDDKKNILNQQVFKVQGEEVYFDLFLVNFEDKYVQDGSKRSMYFWRRVFGNKQKAEEGFKLEQIGTSPERYQSITDILAVENRDAFWKEIWDLSNRPERFEKLGIQAIEGKAIYRKLETGLIYQIELKNTGEVSSKVLSADI